MSNFPKMIKGLTGDDLQIPVRIFDIATKKVIHTAESVNAACKFAGVGPFTVYQGLKRRKINKKNKLGLIITFRYKSNDTIQSGQN